jgi:hypothetical protein
MRRLSAGRDRHLDAFESRRRRRVGDCRGEIGARRRLFGLGPQSGLGRSTQREGQA